MRAPMLLRAAATGVILAAVHGCSSTPAPAPAPAPVVTPTPTPPVAEAAPAPLIDTVPPVLGPAPSVTLPPIDRRTLPNGMTLLVVEQHELPVADFVLVVGSGTEADPAAHGGLASLTASLLREGTTTRSATALADQLSFLGASLFATSGWDMSQVALHTTTAQMDSALALFADVVQRPAFAAADVDRLKKQRLTDLLQARDRPRDIADRVYAQMLYGTAHPYGRPPMGTEQSTTAITRSDIRRFYDTYYRPNNATLIVVGDVTPADVERRARALLGSWPRRAVPQTKYPASSMTAAKPTIYLVDKPGAPQSSIRIGDIGVARSTPDYFALMVMNTILGGSFTSRLNQNLREKRGYTYGAGSGFTMRRQPGPFTARAEVTGTKTDSSLIEFMNELRSIRDTVSSAELARAKRYLELQLPGEFETTSSIASQLVPVVVHNLPLDFYSSYVQQIEQVTQADIRRVAQRYVDPAKMAIVVVGDRASIEPGIRALNLGDVSVRDLNGAVLANPAKP
ncbi:MAG TPA: pitrilysin family protein [Gemmatimonadaceae bacterium]|nr:pitrilysin family protein [Gemmatimonadaceae bacterium]